MTIVPALLAKLRAMERMDPFSEMQSTAREREG